MFNIVIEERECENIGDTRDVDMSDDGEVRWENKVGNEEKFDEQ